jgi:diguanylate cyclase (GGDEF)-like protein/excisionase family DNA binding protein
MTPGWSLRPGDATLTVTRAARVLGVHPNTVRAWSDQGRLRYYRINDRGDRRYRAADLQRFLAAALSPQPSAGTPFGDGAVPVRQRRRGAAALIGVPRDPPPATAASIGERVELLTALGELAASPADVLATLAEACRRIRAATGAAAVGIWQLECETLGRRAVDGTSVHRDQEPAAGDGLLARAVAARGAMQLERGSGVPASLTGSGGAEGAVAIPGPDGPWGVLLVADWDAPDEEADATARSVARVLGALVAGSTASSRTRARLQRSEALRRVAADLARHLDVGRLAAGLAEHARLLYVADRVAVLVRTPAGGLVPLATTGLSGTYLALAATDDGARIAGPAIQAGRPLVLLGGSEAPSPELRAAAVQEGIGTMCVAPIMDGGALAGLLHLAHDSPRAWSPADLDDLAALADDAANAIRAAQTYDRMAGWAAHLQSIQGLGARLSRLTSVEEIGGAIATELRQLIDYHNVRVYRLREDVLVPVAMMGHLGEYIDERPEQLRIAVGEGVTGWVAQHRTPQLVDDAAADERGVTIPGTEDDLPESMLLAPMVHEDQCLGVLVLSKLGLRQFSEDDLRLLVIYASFAAQAMANADATERLRDQSKALERRLQAQRELIRMTESILTTLDPPAVLEQITERLGLLVDCDNIAIEVIDRATGLLVPVTARGAHAGQYLEPGGSGERRISTWVVEHNEPVHIRDDRGDPRVGEGRGDTGDPPPEASLIAVPLIGPDGAAGVLTLERLDTNRQFDDEEFELVKLFAAQVSIALRNAEVHRAVEIRARTDNLTGLLNHGTFKDWLGRSIVSRDPFGLVMIDLDDFKHVNDALGHQAGDRLLVEIGQAIQGAARETDAVFRYGGDEYVVILPRTDVDGATGVAERIQAAILTVGGSGTAWGAGGVQVSASIGLATFPEDGVHAEDVLLAADRACFVAKRGGRGRIATADEGLALAAEFTLSVPTPVDPPTAGRPDPHPVAVS